MQVSISKSLTVLKLSLSKSDVQEQKQQLSEFSNFIHALCQLNAHKSALKLVLSCFFLSLFQQWSFILFAFIEMKEFSPHSSKMKPVCFFRMTESHFKRYLIYARTHRHTHTFTERERHRVREWERKGEREKEWQKQGDIILRRCEYQNTFLLH